MNSVLERFKGRREFVTRLARMAVESESATPDLLRQAIVDQNFETLRFLAHRIKGVTGNLHVPVVQAQAHATEVAARERADDAPQLGEKLATDLQQLLIELQQWTERPDSTQNPPSNA